MKVFRVEHPYDGKGPYHTDYCDWEMESWRLCNCHSDNKNVVRRPALGNEQWNGDAWDFMSIHDDKAKFAFETVKELRQWFRGWIKKMKAKGFVIREYEVAPRNALYGTKQVLFAQLNPHIAEYSL